jgi:hypothetical protein
VQYLVNWPSVTSMIGIIGLQQIQVIVKLPLHQLLWKSSTRSLLTAGSSTLDMCSTCCIPVYYYNSMYCLYIMIMACYPPITLGDVTCQIEIATQHMPRYNHLQTNCKVWTRVVAGHCTIYALQVNLWAGYGNHTAAYYDELQ